MATVALYHNPLEFVRCLIDEDEGRPASQGREGRCIEAAAREATGHWTARPSCVVAFVRAQNPFGYEPVPLKVAGTAKVKYRLGGRIQPLPYPAD